MHMLYEGLYTIFLCAKLGNVVSKKYTFYMYVDCTIYSIFGNCTVYFVSAVLYTRNHTAWYSMYKKG